MMVDHRKLGRELELFCSDPLAGAGLPIWLPAGAAARLVVEAYVRRTRTPLRISSMCCRRRWASASSTSCPGTPTYFGDDMFPPMRMSPTTKLVLRPTLCPHHALVFRSRGRSYRELPLRIAELGGMYRAERLRRARRAEPGAGHLAGRRATPSARPDQVVGEVCRELKLIRRAHADLGVRASGFRLSLRGDGGKFVDDPEMWALAEAVLREALARADIPYDEAPGEAAFYGPKIDIQVRDDAGRELTLSTVQVDYGRPRRFGLGYAGRGRLPQVPVMVHRSMVGSMERLFAHLIEVHAGAFRPGTPRCRSRCFRSGTSRRRAAAAVRDAAIEAGLRADLSAGASLATRIRRAAQRKVPYVAVIGEREAAAGAVGLRPARRPRTAADAGRRGAPTGRRGRRHSRRMTPRSWSCGWHECGQSPQKANHNSKIAGELGAVRS
jgi:threonyl-tRNA synthetase